MLTYLHEQWIAITALAISFVGLARTFLVSRQSQRVDLAERQSCVLIQITRLLAELGVVDRQVSSVAERTIKHIQHDQELVAELNDFTEGILKDKTSLTELYERILLDRREREPAKLETKRGILEEKILKFEERKRHAETLMQRMRETAAQVTDCPGIATT